ncbi:N-acetyltransferase 8 [Colletotrichum sidae]|uniref:N-acetyltransferase 8 n=1 Tax=Colletotrichum sidae TaxID=1347389 RepID=A0A4R8TQJ0_9PEZI|nr:N-acetyltransferase 8 [Colletotrichum sidae]
MKISINTATHEDIPSVAAFLSSARADMFPKLDPEWHRQKNATELAAFAQTYLDTPDAVFLVAHDAGRNLIATIAYLPYDDRFPELRLGREGVVEVARLYVDAAFRRAGLASNLVSLLEQRAREAGVRTLYLHTHPFLDGAIGFWERQGFVKLKVDDDPVWQTTHMSKRIAPHDAAVV